MDLTLSRCPKGGTFWGDTSLFILCSDGQRKSAHSVMGSKALLYERNDVAGGMTRSFLQISSSQNRARVTHDENKR
jgi:hypothetical protein